jgi:hypothetical protein
VVKEVVDAVVRRVLRPWFWLQDAARAVRLAVDALPAELRKQWSWWPPTEWENKALHAASLAITKAAYVGEDQDLNLVPFDRMEALAAAAVGGVVDEYNREQAAKEEGKLRGDLITSGAAYSR